MHNIYRLIDTDIIYLSTCVHAVPPERAAAPGVALVRADRQAIQLYTTTNYLYTVYIYYTSISWYKMPINVVIYS